ncbi:MAG TPA: hypothetical protein VEK57_08495 [Thermoanaerobaculia bacterium]|nr:hypothetical protein [Thermoanaerobaculia bacterium]
MSDLAPRVVLSSTIVAGAAGTFAVDIDDAATALPEEECFRFALQYYARVLFDLVQTQRSVRGLPEAMALLTQTSLEGDDDLFALSGVEGKLVKAVRMPIAEVQVTMRIAGLRNREVIGDLAPFRGSMLARSVVAVFQSVLPRLSPAMRDAIPVALANMNASYEMTHRYADPASQHEVPELAYLAASFV